MRGPHNIWRLIRTGATLERTGAMNVVLNAFDAPPALRFVARALGLRQEVVNEIHAAQGKPPLYTV